MSFFPTDRVAIVAEIGPNHSGERALAYELICEAKDAGADFVKFQAYTADEMVALRGDGPAPEPWGSQGWSMRDLYEEAATPLGWFSDLDTTCRGVGIPWFASVFGAESLAAMEAANCPVYKLAAMEWGNAALREMVRETGKPIIASSPRAPLDVDWAILCPAGYPQPESRIADLDIFDGYSYHGTDPDIPAYAVAAGARYIETHLMLEDEPSKFEAGFAMVPSQFAEVVKRIRKAEAAL